MGGWGLRVEGWELWVEGQGLRVVLRFDWEGVHYAIWVEFIFVGRDQWGAGSHSWKNRLRFGVEYLHKTSKLRDAIEGSVEESWSTNEAWGLWWRLKICNWGHHLYQGGGDLTWTQTPRTRFSTCITHVIHRDSACCFHQTTQQETTGPWQSKHATHAEPKPGVIDFIYKN